MRASDTFALIHTRKAITYESEDYQRMLDTHGITCSMSRRGDWYDNAVIASFAPRVTPTTGSSATIVRHSTIREDLSA
jgi:putative transposase